MIVEAVGVGVLADYGHPFAPITVEPGVPLDRWLSLVGKLRELFLDGLVSAETYAAGVATANTGYRRDGGAP